MKLKVRFFSAYRNITGVDEMTAEKPPGTTVGELFEDIVKIYPSLKKFKTAAMFAVNREFADPDQILRDGDEVAFMPPVGGG